MQAPLSRHLDLYRYWLWKRGVRIMPARGDINPADIAPLLPYLMIVERAGDQFHYRQVGSGIAEAVGHDATGITVGTYIAAPETAAEVRAIFERVFTAAGPVFAKIDLSLLTAPLSEDGVVVDMAISTFAARFNAAFAPEPGWLKGLPVKVDRVLEVGDTAQLETLCREWEQRWPRDGQSPAAFTPL
jgi:PAS domain